MKPNSSRPSTLIVGVCVIVCALAGVIYGVYTEARHAILWGHNLCSGD
jgi:hypothetical protein